jgi:SAM-dependent methyltransferase
VKNLEVNIMGNINDFGKKAAITVYRMYMRLFGSLFDKLYFDPNVPMSELVSHSNWFEHLIKIGNHKGIKILEIGSREVTGKSDARKRFSNAQYVGFDYYPGPNVDVVGDAHKLSQYFDNQEFDIIYSCAVFEHFAMPWVVATEIAKVLKVGGIILIETHFSFGSHERPWHFFQFSDMALKTLFSSALGFECIEAGASNPIVGRFSSFADDYLKFRPVTGLYCHSEYLGRKRKEVINFDWNKLNLEEIVGKEKYPLSKAEV